LIIAVYPDRLTTAERTPSKQLTERCERLDGYVAGWLRFSDAKDPKSIWLRSNRTLLMDSETTISSDVLLPSTEKKINPGGTPVTGYVRDSSARAV